MAAVAAMSPQETAHSTKRKLRMPDTFLAIRDRPSAKPFIQYLRGRKFTDQQIFNMSRRYGMRYDSRGPFKGRIIFPVYYNGRLCTFTGRTIHKSVELRYKTLTEDPEKAEKAGVDPALGAIGEYLLWYDDLMDADADTICIVEGPFDALKVDVLGARHGVCATCFFTSQPSDRQIDLMHELLPRFRRRILIPDQNAEAMGLKTSGRIRALNVEIKMMPKNIKDPGEFCEHDLLRFLEV